MKVIHPFKEEGGHASIVGFECFIITPSYALVVMQVMTNSCLQQTDHVIQGLFAESITGKSRGAYCENLVRDARFCNRVYAQTRSGAQRYQVCSIFCYRRLIN